MKRKPSTEATAAWIRLMRVQSRVLDAVEQDLKKAGFPPLAWYDALLELSRAPSGEMRNTDASRSNRTGDVCSVICLRSSMPAPLPAMK